MNFKQYVQTMQTMLVIPLNNTDSNFELIIPRMIEYAELRLYRELDFLATLGTQTSICTASSRNVPAPATSVVIEGINIITPVGSSADAGVRHPLRRVSIPYMDAWWPAASTTTTAPSVPTVYSLISSGTASPSYYTARVAPTPDAVYNVEFVGTFRPTPLSSNNQETFISVNLPDVFVAASMIFGVGYQRDFGAQAADPQAGLSWEKIYSDLRDGLNIESLRQKAMSADWGAKMPSQMANAALDRVKPS